MHDLPVSTTERRPETSLNVAHLQFIAHQPRDGRTGSHTGRKKGAIPTAREQHWSHKASRARPIGSSRVLERAMGIEPTSEAWEASILPLYDARSLPC